MDLEKKHIEVINAAFEGQLVENNDDDNRGVAARYRGTDVDKSDMITLGKTQVLRVRIIIS
jgi:hypothetical protein